MTNTNIFQKQFSEKSGLGLHFLKNFLMLSGIKLDSCTCCDRLFWLKYKKKIQRYVIGKGRSILFNLAFSDNYTFLKTSNVESKSLSMNFL